MQVMRAQVTRNDTRRPIQRSIWVLLLSCGFWVGNVHAEVSVASAEWQDSPTHRFLEKQISQKLSAQYPEARIKLEIPAPHPQVARRSCDGIQADLPQQFRAARLSVKVICTQPHRWSYYLTVDADISIDVVVPTRTIPRGEKLLPSALGLREVNIAKLHNDWMSGIDEVAGLAARRTLTAGRPVKRSDLEIPLAVQRGQTVQISAIFGTARVSTLGTALEGGRIGDQISVRNSKSGRTIRPWVSGSGQVQTRPLRTAQPAQQPTTALAASG